MKHEMYLIGPNNDMLEIPVLPETVKVEADGAFETYKLNTVGATSVPITPEAKSISFESFFPVENWRFNTAEKYMPADWNINKILEWRDKKIPVRFIYTYGLFPVNMLVVIGEFSYWEEGADGDVNYSLGVSEHKIITPKRIKIIPPKKKPAAPAKKPTAVKKAAPPRQSSKSLPSSYSLVKGDNLWAVSRKYAPKGASKPVIARMAAEIQKLNGIPDSKLRKLPIGLKVKIPQGWLK